MTDLNLINHINDIDLSNIQIGKNHVRVIDFNHLSIKRSFNISFKTFEYHNVTFLSKLFFYSNINSPNYTYFLYFKYLNILINEYKKFQFLGNKYNLNKPELKSIKEALDILEYFLIEHFDNMLNLSDDKGTDLEMQIKWHMNGLASTFGKNRGPLMVDFDNKSKVESQIKEIFDNCFRFRKEELFRFIRDLAQKFEIETGNYWPVSIELYPSIDLHPGSEFVIIKLVYSFAFPDQITTFLNLV